MLDIQLIRETPELVKKNFKKRNQSDKIPLVDELKEKDEEWRQLKSAVDILRSRRNNLSKEINEAKKVGKDVKKIVADARKIPEEIARKEKHVDELRLRIDELMLHLPNMLDESVPDGKSAEDNIEIKKWGKTALPKFQLKTHTELCEALDIADFERSAKIAGRGFYFLKNELVLLEQALIRFTLDILREKGFTLTSVPLMMRREPYSGVCDLTAFQDALYKIENEDLHLIATSEHPMTAQFMDEIIEELPILQTTVSPCFRKEAGGHGVDEKGLFRVHQFNKVEQVVICKPEDSKKWHELMLKNAEAVFKSLKLPYRVVVLCSADIGAVASKTYDLEVWMPRTQQYREAVSCSTIKDFQARRLKIRYRTNEGTRFVHTLNSTAVATTRALVAILENYQQKDGSVKIPDVLQKYMGMKVIRKK
ncbi:serine--tRNA ligase [Candidatus Azambacteria bacterium RIFCSPHIGHO2_01_FULL_40_24]|uniref:Serine--tRNA ligase n=1 Tax=Candidatus Azambacteria bacterium RIFCSPHIGHO2_01_FULL_40_24 TaxID=1797301 RepID=A0A1F5B3I2_9BACT|nr:serine--tRNA ligase [Candidatus Woesearchaeota archaeon]OGD25168.1 MAG: serine--tRNA ligase [Candidatus Azambacteria bacterium RIFCSPHIGHO2_01_FULL_40_24]